MCKLGESLATFGLYSVCGWFAGVYTLIKSTKIKFIPIICKSQVWDFLIDVHKTICIKDLYKSQFTPETEKNCTIHFYAVSWLLWMSDQCEFMFLNFRFKISKCRLKLSTETITLSYFDSSYFCFSYFLLYECHHIGFSEYKQSCKGKNQL